MYAKFIRADTTVVWLTGQTPREGASGATLNGDHATEELGLFMAAAIMAVNRDHQRNEVSFSWRKTIASEDAGWRWIAAQQTALRSNGAAQIICGSYTFQIADAQAQFGVPVFSPGSLVVQVRITGGALTEISTPPASEELFGIVQITGQLKSVTVAVADLTATGIVRVNVTGNTTSVIPIPVVTVGAGSFTIDVLRQPELTVGDGLLYEFSWDVVALEIV
jgi:hypothetical protein